MASYPPFSRPTLLGNALATYKAPKRKVFISYHHKKDQQWYDQFSQYFSDQLDLFSDNSVERAIDSDNAEYLNRKIREEFIVGTSLTIVLCGAETYKRRWVDWEIHATLHHEHGLLGIGLPTCARDLSNNKYIVPDRFFENHQSGYAVWMEWTATPAILIARIEEAVKISSQTLLIRNNAVKMKRSSP